jgi:predicted enzyme related to lactoylglutathione lyase
MGKVQHFEIPADDVGRARTFYADVFGWSIQGVEGSDDVALIEPAGDQGEAGVIGGDLYRREKPDAPTVVITVASLEQVLDDVERAGGRRIGEITSMPGMGRAAYFEDTEGNRLGLWENEPARDEASGGA